MYAAVEDRRSGSRMVVFDVHIGESQASWERQKVIPDSVDDACSLNSRSTSDMQQSKTVKAAGTWQVNHWQRRKVSPVSLCGICVQLLCEVWHGSGAAPSEATHRTRCVQQPYAAIRVPAGSVERGARAALQLCSCSAWGA